MTREEFLSLRDFIYEKTGIFFAENKMYLLESRLSNRLNELGFMSYDDYYFFLKYGNEDSRKELNNLFDVVTTNETSFFRNPPQLDAFKIMLQKNYMNNNNNPIASPLKIWSAACSTGEEPYTLAIMILEMIELTRKNIPFTIFATDISYRVLESAKKGVYGPYSIRNMDGNIIKKYFIQKGDSYAINDNVKRFVKFEHMNLVDSNAYKRFRYMDIIFCRNVLIYFDEKAKKMVIDNLYESLKPGGFLTIGHAESLHNISRAFRPIMFPGAIAYQKG
ncbi:MAG: protein-glutamate O-methyltransferase CheR [Syntrophorhabdaceae bacterium]|nr:protein-glutamate O-methyltransferase CheR [Syntrophorhabdales bacterium]MBP9561304.1 protein-glutamate O-methyltransferase CheR [Syntrophorhabdaceae bacterium]